MHIADPGSGPSRTTAVARLEAERGIPLELESRSLPINHRGRRPHDGVGLSAS